MVVSLPINPTRLDDVRGGSFGRRRPAKLYNFLGALIRFYAKQQYAHIPQYMTQLPGKVLGVQTGLIFYDPRDQRQVTYSVILYSPAMGGLFAALALKYRRGIFVHYHDRRQVHSVPLQMKIDGPVPSNVAGTQGTKTNNAIRVVGGIAGGVLFLGLVVSAWIWLFHRRRRIVDKDSGGRSSRQSGTARRRSMRWIPLYSLSNTNTLVSRIKVPPGGRGCCGSLKSTRRFL